MEIQVQTPSHLCPECGEWWMVEPAGPGKWLVIRYGDHTYTWCESAAIPQCPDCANTLDPWLIGD